MSKEKELLENHLQKYRNLENEEETEILNLIDEIQPVITAFNNENTELLQNEKVQRYLVVAELLEKYQKMAQKLERAFVLKIQADCPHKMWYLIHSESDDYEGRTYWTCRCLDCGFMSEERSRNFRYVITGPGIFGRVSRHEKTYNQVQQEYRILQDKYDNYYENKQLDEDLYNENTVRKVFIKKYR